MHRSMLCLPLLLATLAGCDDAPTDDAAVVEPGACGMTLPGVGTWTVGQYTDGYLIDANREVALRSAGEGRMWWHRLDGTDGGPVDLGVAISDDQRVDLYDADHVLIRGVNDRFEQRARLIRLSDNRIVHEMEYRFEGQGEWVITGNTTRAGAPQPRLRSLRTGETFELPCQPCGLQAIDGFGRAWIRDTADNSLMELELSTGRVTHHRDLNASQSEVRGAGLVVRDGNARMIFGAASTPVVCHWRQVLVASTGHIACPFGLEANDAGVKVLGSDGQETRREADLPTSPLREFGLGFLVGDYNVAWVPFAASEPVVRVPGIMLARTRHVAILADLESAQTRILHADGRVVTLDYAVTSPPDVTADGTLALVRRAGDFAVIDLDTGAVTLEVPLGSGTKRFAGHVVVADGARLGEATPANLSKVVFPDRACPVVLYEQCVGGECDLLIQQFEDPTLN